MTGQLQRYVMHNQREIKKLAEEVTGIKLIRSGTGEKMCIAKGVSVPQWLNQKPIFLPAK